MAPFSFETSIDSTCRLVMSDKGVPPPIPDPDVAGRRAGDSHNKLPPYAPLLASRHAAHRTELREIVAELAVETARLVLDVPCGDGFYSACFADAVPAGSRVIAADLSFRYLQAARNLLGEYEERVPVLFVEADSYGLPFPDELFDLAWCAQSLLSLKQPVAALKEMQRVVRRGGYVAVLEEDRVNEMWLPWPAELERGIRQAEQRALDELMKHHADDSNPARHTTRLLQEAGLTPHKRSTYVIHRSFPVPEKDQAFLRHYFSALSKRLRPHLAPAQLAWVDRLTDPKSDAYLPYCPEFRMRWQEIVSLGAKK